MIEKSEWSCFSAPGRVCLYGEHQDYLDLKVVPAAINLRTTIGLRRINGKYIKAQSIDLNIHDEFKIDSNISFAGNAFDYLRAVVKVLFAEGKGEKLSGLEVKIKSDVPIGSGLSSSAALLVSWLTALNELFYLGLSRREIAFLAFKAENKELGINCGIMDQYASALGGVFSLNCAGPPFTITEFDAQFDGLVIGDSLIRRAANDPLTIRKKQIFSGSSKIREVCGYGLKTLTMNQLEEAKALIAPEELLRLKAVVTIRDITNRACQELTRKNHCDQELLGKLLTAQHNALRDWLEVSIPKLDKLVEVSIKAGALGAKLSGAGFGGCIVAFAPGREKAVATAIESAGGKAILCKTDSEGGRKENSCPW